jgi:hypothetical protein
MYVIGRKHVQQRQELFAIGKRLVVFGGTCVHQFNTKIAIGGSKFVPQ